MIDNRTDKRQERRKWRYRRDIESDYTLGSKPIGTGTSSEVYQGRRRRDGKIVAVKKIPKVAGITGSVRSNERQARHTESIQRQIELLVALRGSLSVARLSQVYEDDDTIYLIMEMCKGGSILDRMRRKGKVFSEKQVSEWMHGILQTLSVCHARNIIHREVRPENFLFLSKSRKSPLKAIHFGNALQFTPEVLPVTASLRNGNVWYMAPEACRGQWSPLCDVWSCGIMVYYMLTGTFPFTDRDAPMSPDLAVTLKSICFEDIDTSSEAWGGLSEQAASFLKYVLVKDPSKRPSAVECWMHPWIQDPISLSDNPLPSVVQKLQSWSQQGAFKCSVMELIGRDLVSMHFGNSQDKSQHAAAVFRERSVRAGKLGMDAQHSGSLQQFLPQDSPYSQSLTAILDQLETDKEGSLDKKKFHASLIKLGHSLELTEAEEMFEMLDADGKGHIGRSDIALSLIDWNQFRDTFKDRWIASLRKVFDKLDQDRDGCLSMEEIASAFEGDLCEYEVDAAVHDVLLQMTSIHGKKGIRKGEQLVSVDFENFLELMNSDAQMKLSLFQNRCIIYGDKSSKQGNMLSKFFCWR